MDKKDEQKIKTLIHKLGLKYKLSDIEIKQIVDSPYQFAQLKIKELKLDDLIDETELINIKSNFMFTGFAKLFINPLALKNRLKKRDNK